MDIKKLVIGTPIVSIIIFTVFCICFENFTSIYQIINYQPYEVSVIEINQNEGYIYIQENGMSFEEGTKVKLIYSEKKPALKGVIGEHEKQKIKVCFENISKISDEEIEQALFKIETGKIAIGEELKLWN